MFGLAGVVDQHFVHGMQAPFLGFCFPHGLTLSIHASRPPEMGREGCRAEEGQLGIFNIVSCILLGLIPPDLN